MATNTATKYDTNLAKPFSNTSAASAARKAVRSTMASSTAKVPKMAAKKKIPKLQSAAAAKRKTGW